MDSFDWERKQVSRVSSDRQGSDSSCKKIGLIDDDTGDAEYRDLWKG